MFPIRQNFHDIPRFCRYGALLSSRMSNLSLETPRLRSYASIVISGGSMKCKAGSRMFLLGPSDGHLPRLTCNISCNFSSRDSSHSLGHYPDLTGARPLYVVMKMQAETRRANVCASQAASPVAKRGHFTDDLSTTAGYMTS